MNRFMNKFFGFLFLSFLLAMATGCTPEDLGPGFPNGTPPNFDPCGGVAITIEDLPASVLDYLEDNFPNYDLNEITEYINGTSVQFGLQLEQNDIQLELLFSEDGILISSGNNVGGQAVPLGDLPQAVIDFINENYPDLNIDLAELELQFGLTFLEIELSDNMTVIFNAAGEFLCASATPGNNGGGNDCTRGYGYWKTHSEYGPAPYDNTWAELDNGADTEFLGTGQTYYEIMQATPAGGNAFIILAHKWITAQLNVLAGASIPDDVLDAWNQAADLLVTYQDTQMIPTNSSDGQLALQLGSILNQFNEGGDCDDE